MGEEHSKLLLHIQVVLLTSPCVFKETLNLTSVVRVLSNGGNKSSALVML